MDYMKNEWGEVNHSHELVTKRFLRRSMFVCDCFMVLLVWVVCEREESTVLISCCSARLLLLSLSTLQDDPVHQQMPPQPLHETET